jgi:uncharacterized protein YjbI with pentapeptide repeats
MNASPYQLSDPLEVDSGESVQLSRISEEKLRAVCEAHKQWLKSAGANGKRADLRNLDFQGMSFVSLHDFRSADCSNAVFRNIRFDGVDFQQANLRNAVLAGANLGRANLRGADLQNADLQGAYLVGSNITDCTLRGANLQDAQLRGIPAEGPPNYPVGLTARVLAGTDITGVSLPDGILKFEGLTHVEAISKNASKMFLALLAGCVYSWLTIGMTTDARLLANSSSSPLPVINTEVPIVGFYLIAPLVLTCVYAYLHFYLIHLWRSLADLPAIFPDGEALDDKAYPWLPICLVRAHAALLRRKRPPLSHRELCHHFSHVVVGAADTYFLLAAISSAARLVDRHSYSNSHCGRMGWGELL